MDEELKFLDLVDYNYWMNLGVVLNTTDKYLQIKELQKYFKISSMQVLAEHDFLVQYKRVSSDISLESRVNAWFKQR